MKKPGSRTAYILGKLARYCIAISLILTINFFLPRMMPGDPVINLLGEDARNANHFDKNVIAELHKYYGLDKPLHIQYINYLFSIKDNNLGYSIHKKLSVAELIGESFYWTLALLLPSTILGALMALIFGSISGFRQGQLGDISLSIIFVLIFTCPCFLFAILTISIFGFRLGWFPLSGFSSGPSSGLNPLFDIIWHLTLPVIVLSLANAAYIFFIVRNMIAQTMSEYFIFVAKSKGISERAIIFNHVLRNVMPPFISIIALELGFMVSGALIVEIVFSLNGMGTLIYDAMITRDFPVIQGVFLIVTIFVLAANFFADLLYGIADPRIGDAASSINM